MKKLVHQPTNEMAPRFQPGTIVYSKADPVTKLAVMKYEQRIYYCAVIGNAKNHNLAFLECQIEADII